MALPFFRALNPLSENSGITYWFPDDPCYGREMLDDSMLQTIEHAYRHDYDLMSALQSTYAAITGEHYDLNGKGQDTARGGSKGALDLLIFPLVARKLIIDALLPENKNKPLQRLWMLCLALPLEASRLLLGLTLTLLLSPLVLLIHLVKPKPTLEDAQQEVESVEQEPEEIQQEAEERPHIAEEILQRLERLRQEQQINSQQLLEIIQQLREENEEQDTLIPEIDPSVNHKKLEQLAEASGFSLDNIPDDFTCPISLQVMTDPVFVTAHPMHRFERAYIEAYFTKRQLNPINREVLNLDGIQEDIAMRERIGLYIEEQLQRHTPSGATASPA